MRRDFEDLSGADPWAVLDIARDVGAEDLKRAYHRLARKIHPDTGSGAEDLIKRVNLAYAIVSEPRRAEEYADRLRRAAEPVPSTPAPDPPAPEEESTAYTEQFDWQEGPGPGAGSTTYRETIWPDHQDEYGYHTEPLLTERIPPVPTTVPPPDRFTQQPAWNRLALISLVMTFLCFPVSLFTGFAALSQIRTTGERGAGLAWTAIILSAAPILFVCAGQLLGGR